MTTLRQSKKPDPLISFWHAPSMRRTFPSMGNLRAFEVSARLLSFTRAAEELGITQGAVSRRIAILEEMFGFPLFTRTNSGLSLNSAGETYLREVRACLNRIETATGNLLSTRGIGGVLNLAVIPTFASRWLIPRMKNFSRGHPAATVNLIARFAPFDFESAGLDAAIHFGDSNWPRAILEPLMREEAVVVCCPALAAPEQGLKTPFDLTEPGRTRLQLISRPHAWNEWLKAAGVSCGDMSDGPLFELISMTIEAAIAGMGYALVPRFLAEIEIDRGVLVVPFPPHAQSEKAYWLVYPENKQYDPLLCAFRDWLVSEI